MQIQTTPGQQQNTKNFAGLTNGCLDLCSPHMVSLTEKRKEEQKSEGQYNVNYTDLPEKYLAMGVLMHNHW